MITSRRLHALLMLIFHLGCGTSAPTVTNLSARGSKEGFLVNGLKEDPYETLQEERLPQFMLDLYNVVAFPNGVSRPGAPNLTKAVNCIFVKDASSKCVNEATEFQYAFTLPAIVNSEGVEKAELRLYKTKSGHKNATGYQRTGTRFFRADLIDSSGVTVSSPLLSSSSYGWTVFDLTWAVRSWVKQRIVDVRLRVVPRYPYAAGRPQLSFSTKTNTANRAHLVIYSNDNAHLQQKLSSHLNMVENDKETVPAAQYNSTNHRQKRSNTRRKLCQKKSFVITWKEAGYFKVLLPYDADIYRCVGECRTTELPAAMKTTHAIIHRHVSMAGATRSNGKPAVRGPCCAPKTLKPLKVLFRDSDFFYTELDQAIAESCHCA